MKKFNYPVQKNSSKDTRHTGIGEYILGECEKMKRSREYKEREWDEANHAYQTVISEYKRAFDQNKAPEIQFRDKQMSDIKLPLEFAVIQRKLTFILSNTPKPKWLALAKKLDDEQKQSKGKVFTHIFDYVWYLCDGDWEEFKTIISSLIYSIGYLSWFHEYYEYDCEMPDDFKNGVLTYKKVKKVISRTKLRNEDVRHVLLDYNASDLRDVQKGAIVRHYNKPTFEKLFANYSIDGIQPITPIECFMKVGEERGSQDKEIYETIYYYDEGLDRFAIASNGYHINPYRGERVLKENEGWSPIPSFDKKFPVAFWIDHYLDSELYAMGECQLTKPFREIKNKTRNMVFDVMKKIAFQTIIIDPLSDFDEDEYEFGQPFIRAEINDVKPLPVSANLDFTVRMDEGTNNDIAIFTGINISDTANPVANETATKTAARRESQFAIIENYIKQNMSYGWKRLWLGMKDTIKLGYRVPQVNEDGEKTGFLVRTDGVKLFRSQGKTVEEKKDGSYIFETKPDDLEGDFELIPEMSNVAYTKELEDEKKREGIAKLKEYQNGEIDTFKLAEIEAELTGLPMDVVNPNPNVKEGDINLEQTPETITKNLDLLAKPPTKDELFAKNMGQMANPEGETPSKRVTNAGALPGIQPTEQGNPAIVS
uniref:Portal protein n=1 Tax=viral metagenome TaxID=1070528 RepID=A0A6H1ZRK3_9ZZZZ